jgi:hypothetical protein
MKMRLMQKKISSSGIARLSSHFISRSFINQNESHPCPCDRDISSALAGGA